MVLNRISPGAGDQRRQWLSLRWQAAAAALDHRQASLALRRLVNGDLVALASLELVNGRRGLDQLAEHEAAIGRMNEAAAVLLMAPNPARLGQGRSGWRARMPSRRTSCWSRPWTRPRLIRPGDWRWICCSCSCACNWQPVMAPVRASAWSGYRHGWMTATPSGSCRC